MLEEETFSDILVNSPTRTYLRKVIQLGKRWDNDLKALRFILDSDDQLPLIFVTSKLTLKEIEKAPPQKRSRMLELYNSLLKYGNPQKWPRPSNLPGRPTKGTLNSLRRILPDENDAKHVYQSLIMRCNIFLTSDHKSILRYKKKLSVFGVNAKSPYELVVDTYGEDLWKRGAGLALQ
jgi:hypothetical protein